MADPMTGEIKMFAFSWAPRDYAKCEGQVESASSNPALFSLLGYNFGGNGSSTYALPDLRGRVPIGRGVLAGGIHQHIYAVGEKGGLEYVTLRGESIPSHTHQVSGKEEPTSANPAPDTGEVLCDNLSSANYVFSQDTSGLTQMSPNTCSTQGADQSHYNMMPSIAINFCIALKGTYPQRN